MTRNELVAFLWQKHQDLNFGEINEVTLAVESAAEAALFKIRARKNRAENAIDLWLAQQAGNQ